MARETLAEAKAELMALLAPGGVPAAPSVGHVSLQEPTVAYPVAGKATVTVASGGMAPTEWPVVVRIYADARTDPVAAAELCDQAMTEVDELFGTFGGRATWMEPEYNPEQRWWVTRTTIPLPREDF